MVKKLDGGHTSRVESTSKQPRKGAFEGMSGCRCHSGLFFLRSRLRLRATGVWWLATARWICKAERPFPWLTVRSHGFAQPDLILQCRMLLTRISGLAPEERPAHRPAFNQFFRMKRIEVQLA